MKNFKKRQEKKPSGRKRTIRQTWQYHLLMLPGILVVFTYTIIPFFGNVMAFQDFQPILGFQIPLGGACQFQKNFVHARCGENLSELTTDCGGQTAALHGVIDFLCRTAQ